MNPSPSPVRPTYDPTTTKIDFPPGLDTTLGILLKEKSAKENIRSEATAALGDTISKFASHFSSRFNMWAIFDAIKTFITMQPAFSDQFNYTNQLALILDRISPDKTRDEKAVKLIADFKEHVACQGGPIGQDVAIWVAANGDKITPICAKFLQIVLDKVGFPTQQKSWASAITILQNINCILLPRVIRGCPKWHRP